ncbi:RNA polymerase sigma factor [Massilia sp. NR 4-1]|uniref:RNA polymerase sigma factor n=1 Tax=Massilia sp. NR 4-1 TaxID=1678028 RepID=UPI00067BE90B|nr:RNA polymerase sigma factor [Massilia sp. NR 4-1]AKU20301.1 RNA polymerase subunit sigma-24 [Massilia sp. NR 4-1]
MTTHQAIHQRLDAVWRIESARIIAVLTRMLRDVGLAEEMAQDALVSALEIWPEKGMPENAAAWLMTVAKNRALDHLRHHKLARDKEAELTYEIEGLLQDAAPDLEKTLDDNIGDDLLRLVFISCHPVLPTEGRVALTLRLLGGLSTEEIARAFLVAEPTIAQRIVRAKRTLADKRVPYEVPRGAELEERLSSVLQVIYLIFNEGYSASAGADWMRPALCEEALRLARILAGLAPQEPEVHGLAALLEIQSSRLRARCDARGRPVLLLEQDRSRWDQLLIGRGLAALERAARLQRPAGPYVLQAEIAACHARARKAEDTEWLRIAALYHTLSELASSPVVELNRAVAVSMAFGPAEGLAVADTLLDEPLLRNYHLLPSVRGDLLFKLGRLDEARAEFERAAGMTQNERERDLLLTRAATCHRRLPPTPPGSAAPAA